MALILSFGIGDGQKSSVLKKLERTEETLSSLSTASLVASNALYITGSNNLGRDLFAVGGVALGAKFFQTLRRHTQARAEGAADLNFYPTRWALICGAAAFGVGAAGVGTAFAIAGFTLAGAFAATVGVASAAAVIALGYALITGKGEVTWNRFKKQK